MKHWFLSTKRWSLIIASAASLAIGATGLLSCGGEGGPVDGGGGGGGGNSYTQKFLALLPAGQAGATYVGPETCKGCHNGVGPNGKAKSMHGDTGEAYYDDWSGTKHFTKNVTCESCHGPGSNHAANPSTDTILTAPNSASPYVCAQCHGPIYDQWYASKHRQLVTAPVEEAGTNPNQYGRNSRCIQCHSGLFRVETAEKGDDVGLLTDQQIIDLAEETINNVPHTAACNTCHNPHKVTGNFNGDGEERQLRHKTFNLDTTDIGPSQPASKFVNFDHICAQCHNGRGTDPSDAKLQSGTSRPSMHDSNQYNMLMGIGGVVGGGNVDNNTAHQQAPGQCSHCHMPDASHTFTTKYDVSCAPCHSAQDAAARVTQVRAQILDDLYALLTRMQTWSQNTFGDPDLWDYTSNIQALGKTPPAQNLIPIEIKRSRHNYFFIIRDACFGPHNYPYAHHLITVANDNLDALGIPGPPPKGNITTSQERAIFLAQLKRWQEIERTAED